MKHYVKIFLLLLLTLVLTVASVACRKKDAASAPAEAAATPAEVYAETVKSDKETWQAKGFDVTALTAASRIRKAEADLGAGEGDVFAMLFAQKGNTDRVCIYYFVSAEKAQQCYEQNFSQYSAYSCDGIRLVEAFLAAD